MRDNENIEELLLLKPDYVGFIFYEKSKRCVGVVPEVLFPENVKKVGVFVNESLEIILSRIKDFNLDLVQLHGDESPEFCNDINKVIPVIKAFGVDEAFDFSILDAFKNGCTYFLFDTKTINRGGSGKSFNWGVLKEYNGEVPFFLSGGISREDIEKIKGFKHPQLHAIDINSCFETEPAFKNIQLIKEFKNEL